MKTAEVNVSCLVHDSFRVQQVAGMFDVPLAEKLSETFHAEIPDASEPWRVGLIVGPSGSGKSTVAREVFGGSLYSGHAWPEDRAVIDCVGELPTREIVGMFTAVGFSSPPSWVKPYHVLSRGEQFRCDLVRALAQGRDHAGDSSRESQPIVAFDEFTSVVDRNVARVGSAAVAEAIRNDRINVRFVAITCHYDVIDWLAPDWVVDMSTGTCQRRCLRRPEIKLELFRSRRSAWRMFARHHYLSGSLSAAARCHIAYVEDLPVCFCATLPIIGRRKHWRITRVVTLPDYQGIGIGMRTAEAVADLHLAEGHRLNVTASHPALLAHCGNSPNWRAVNVRKSGSPHGNSMIHDYRGSAGRAVVSFEYLGNARVTESKRRKVKEDNK